jgi:exonuclease SbcC
VEHATETATAAAEALEAAKRDHAAHAVAATLVAGQPCPVCLQQVAALPDRPAPAALSAAEKASAAAAKQVKAAQAALAPLAEQRAKWQQTLASLNEQLAEVEQRLAEAPDLAAIDRSLTEIVAADAALVTARQRDGAARAALAQATAAADDGRKRREAAWSQFDTARDGLAAFGPPATKRDDLGAAWAALSTWARDEGGRRQEAATAARDAATTAAADLQALQSKLAARCDECAVVVGNTRARDAVADAIAAAQAEHRRLQTGLEQAERWRLEVKTHVETADVAKALVGHLSSRGFERWLLDEALGQLAIGASTVLRELSAGQYSLALDGQNNFVVIDHRSADEQRPARTLSGGETFLASLSLALTLAEHLTQLAVGSEPRLESIFLDEGFGTLDAETLDVVAAAIEELQSRGRTVGLVTHVRELAERMPVRFEVRKGPAGSTVERVER